MTETKVKYLLWTHVSQNNCSCHYLESHHQLLLDFYLLMGAMTRWMRGHRFMTRADMCCYFGMRQSLSLVLVFITGLA